MFRYLLRKPDVSRLIAMIRLGLLRLLSWPIQFCSARGLLPAEYIRWTSFGNKGFTDYSLGDMSAYLYLGYHSRRIPTGEWHSSANVERSQRREHWSTFSCILMWSIWMNCPIGSISRPLFFTWLLSSRDLSSTKTSSLSPSKTRCSSDTNTTPRFSESFSASILSSGTSGFFIYSLLTNG